MDSMASRESIIVYKSVLSVFTQEFSLVVSLHVRPENEPKKIGKSRYFWVFRTDQKKKFALVRPMPFSFFLFQPLLVKAVTSLVVIDAILRIRMSIAFKWYIMHRYRGLLI